MATQGDVGRDMYKHGLSSCEMKPRFKSVQIFKDQVLGHGPYGSLYKAKCDDLLCAAKIINKLLLEDTCAIAQQQFSPEREHRVVLKRFEQEYEVLSTLRHPNIVQFMGMCSDPDTGGAVLLMELMDKNLTGYLEANSLHPVPYHVQVNICHSVALALSYLHANSITVRGISSNDVLLAGSAQVIKLHDFVWSAFDSDDLTMCPDVYMPPEALTDDPILNTKGIDCFSFGVVTIQVLTREWPNPGTQTGYTNITEVERRQNHISQIDPGHSLLSIALDCLKDRAVERPIAHELCERIGALKEGESYIDSKKRNSVPRKSNTDLHEQLVSERQRHTLEQEHNREEI